MKKESSFNVIAYDFNLESFLFIDVLAFFRDKLKGLNKKERPKTFEEYKSFVIKEGMRQYWSRSEYEVILVPLHYSLDNPMKESMKIDVWEQIKNNQDLIVKLLTHK